MNRRFRFRLIVGITTLGAITACVVDPLNPQPLPPGPPENGATFGMDGGARPVASDASSESVNDSGGLRDQDGASPDANDTNPGVPAIDGGDAGDADADAG